MPTWRRASPVATRKCLTQLNFDRTIRFAPRPARVAKSQHGPVRQIIVGVPRWIVSFDAVVTYAVVGVVGRRLWTFVNTKLAGGLLTLPRRRGTLDLWRPVGRETSCVDCGGTRPEGQSSKRRCGSSQLDLPAVDRSGQTLRISQTLRFAAIATGCRTAWIVLLIVMSATVFPAVALGQLVDHLDSYPPRWRLDDGDTPPGESPVSSILSHRNIAAGGHDRGAHERLVVQSEIGEATLIYPIQPVRILDDLNATVYVRCSSVDRHSSATVGFRIRYPYLADPMTRRIVTRVVDGAAYRDGGRWQRIGIGSVTRAAAAAVATVRAQYGSRADVRDAMIDAVTIRVSPSPTDRGGVDRSGASPSLTSATGGHAADTGWRIDIDELNVDGMIPVGLEVAGARRARPAIDPGDVSANIDHGVTTARPNPPPIFDRSTGTERIIEYHGEPMAWLRSLGFDAIWLSRPVDAAVLSEADRNHLRIFAPPPSVIDRSLTPLLNSVAAWILQPTPSIDDPTGPAILDARYLSSVHRVADRLRDLPSRWQRPLIAAPVESLGQYARHVDAVVHHAAPRTRGLAADDRWRDVWQSAAEVPVGTPLVLSIQTTVPPSAAAQNDLVSRSLGGNPDVSNDWQSIWVETMQGLASAPDAILFRSPRSLAGGDRASSARAAALSYINRTAAMIDPVFSPPAVRRGDRWSRPPSTGQTPYHLQTAVSPAATWHFVTSADTGVGYAAAGDGGSITVPVTGSMAYRVTHFAAEMLPVSPDADGGGRSVQIVSPDVCEIIVSTDDASIGGRLAASAARLRDRAATDRLELARSSLRRLIAQRQFVGSVGSVAGNGLPTQPLVLRQLQRDARLVDVAARTLESIQPGGTSGDMAATLRSAARGDAWITRASMSLRRSMTDPSIANRSSAIVSWPSAIVGDATTQWMLQTSLPDGGPPRLDDTADQSSVGRRLDPDVIRYSRNLLSSGDFDSPSSLGHDHLGGRRWSIGRRLTHITGSEVAHHRGDVYAGAGAIRAAAWMTGNSVQDIGGGYGGTVLQIQSPPVRFAVDRDSHRTTETVVVGAMIKTVGFTGPHQGVLMYDSVGGPELGVLVQGRPGWTPVQLVRHLQSPTKLTVQFELIGPGEAIIDEVTVRTTDRPGR